MNKFIDVSGKTEEEAIASALSRLGKTRDEVSVEIVERAKSGFLGLGASPAVVRVSYEDDEPETIPETVPEAKAASVKTAPAKSAPNESGDTAARTEAFVAGLLEYMEIRAQVEVRPRENGGLNVNLSGSGMGAVIGRRGETLDAIQLLTNYSVNRGSEKRVHISVDAENYRSKREESLVHLAEKMAAKAIKYHRSMALEPMNSYERHVIHSALQDFEGVTTSSTGVEPNRRVVISCERPQSQSSHQPREWS